MERPKLTDERRAILTARFAETRTAELAREMGVNYRTLCRWAAEMGLEKSKEFRRGMSAIATIGSKRTMYRKGHWGTCPSFDDEKKVYLQKYFATILNTVLARALGVSDRTIRRWAQALGLKKDREVIELHRRSRMLPTPEQWFFVVATVRELYPDGRDEEATERTGYSTQTIYEIARKYGIRRSEAYMQAVREARTKRTRELFLGKKRPRTLELEQVVRETYADTPVPEIAQRLGISEIYVRVLAGRLGLRKSRKFVHDVRSTRKKKHG